VLELKVARPGKKTLDQALAEGLDQLRSKDYAAELRAAGAAPVHAFAVAFDGREVRVREARWGRRSYAPAPRDDPEHRFTTEAQRTQRLTELNI
jgi:hypothetical protein